MATSRRSSLLPKSQSDPHSPATLQTVISNLVNLEVEGSDERTNGKRLNSESESGKIIAHPPAPAVRGTLRCHCIYVQGGGTPDAEKPGGEPAGHQGPGRAGVVHAHLI